MSEDLSKLDLFIKIMRMTESDNDGVSLVALRKANALLKAEKWDWEKLLRGKIKVISDPFGPATAPQAAPPPQAAAFHAQPVRPRPQPQPQPQPGWTAAPNPWPNGQKPQPRPASSHYQPTGPKVAPAGPLHFRRNSKDEWCIASHIRIDSAIGQTVEVHKKDGTKEPKTVGMYSEQLSSGYYLYKMANASKWDRKFADQKVGINDIF